MGTVLHTTVKAPGEKLFAVADWNSAHNLTGIIQADGSVPFAANQSLGNNNLTNVKDPVNIQDADTKNARETAITAHNNLATGVHGVGASTVDSVANRDTAITNHAANASAHHVKYTDGEAVTAMGAKADNNPLNHDRYADAEAVSAMGAKDDSNPLNHDKLLLVAAGSNGTEAANAGDNTTAARSDHEHYIYHYLVFVVPGVLFTGDKAGWLRIENLGANGDILSAYAVLKTAGSTSTTIDILKCSQANIDGVPSWSTIFTNKITIDANERSSNTAATPPSFSATSWSANDHFRINIDAAGTNASELTVMLKIRSKNRSS